MYSSNVPLITLKESSRDSETVICVQTIHWRLQLSCPFGQKRPEPGILSQGLLGLLRGVNLAVGHFRCSGTGITRPPGYSDRRFTSCAVQYVKNRAVDSFWWPVFFAKTGSRARHRRWISCVWNINPNKMLIKFRTGQKSLHEIDKAVLVWYVTFE